MGRILVLGDIILDDYRLVEISRVSPEAPCLVGKHMTEYYRLGGAANVANNLKALTDDLLLVGRCCETTVLPLILEAEIPQQVWFGQNSVKVRFIDKKTRNQLFRYDVEAGDETRDDEEETESQKTGYKDADYAVQVIVDYLKGTVNRIAQVKCPINVFSTKTPNPSRLIRHRSEQNVLILNQGEFERADKGGMREFTYVIRTEGDDGISLFHGPSLLIIRHFDALRVDVFDVTGAGDTVTAVIAFCLSEFGLTEETLAKACFCANIEASKVVSMHGTAVVASSRDDILRTFRSLEGDSF